MSITREIESGIESLLFWGAFGGALSETIGGSLGGAINELARWLLRHELAEWYINGDGVAHRMLRGLVTGTVTGGVCGAMGGTISGAICCRKVNECEPDEYIIGSGIAVKSYHQWSLCSLQLSLDSCSLTVLSSTVGEYCSVLPTLHN